MLKKANKILIGIIILGLGLRLFGIKHGFPFIFHPDEPAVVRSALGIRFYKNPGHFDWPHLYFYLNYFVYTGFAFFRNILVSLNLKEVIVRIAPLFWNDELIFYLISRIISALLGTFTIIPVYLTAKNMFNKKTAVYSALAFCIIPFHVWRSHYGLIDVPMVFFLSWVLYFSSLIITKNKFKYYVFAGFFAGLAASTKYHGGLGAILIPLSYLTWYFTQCQKSKIKFLKFSDIRNILVSGASSVLGFLAGTPFALFDFKTFRRTDSPAGAFWQFKNVGSVRFKIRLIQIFDAVFLKISDDLGYFLLLLYLVGLGILIFRLIKKAKSQDNLKLWFLYIPSLFFIYYISGFEKTRSHYYMLIYPFVAVCFGYFLDYFVEILRTKWHDNCLFLVIIIFSVPLLLSIRRSYIFYLTDSRVSLFKWLTGANIDSKVLYDKSLDEIMKKADVKEYADFQDNYVIKKSDFLIFIPESMPILPDHGYQLEKVEKFGSKLNRGPNIEIYQAQ